MDSFICCRVKRKKLTGSEFSYFYCISGFKSDRWFVLLASSIPAFWWYAGYPVFSSVYRHRITNSSLCQPFVDIILTCTRHKHLCGHLTDVLVIFIVFVYTARVQEWNTLRWLSIVYLYKLFIRSILCIIRPNPWPDWWSTSVGTRWVESDITCCKVNSCSSGIFKRPCPTIIQQYRRIQSIWLGRNNCLPIAMCWHENNDTSAVVNAFMRVEFCRLLRTRAWKVVLE